MLLCVNKKKIMKKFLHATSIIILHFTFYIFHFSAYSQSWSELGGLNGLATNGGIFSVCSDAFGNVYVAGFISNSSGKQYVAKYNGSVWSGLGGLNTLAA